MSFIQRSYEDIARDVLTSLTQGVSQEVHRVSYDATARPVQVPDVVLRKRPVRRVSFVKGFLINPEPDGDPIPTLFGLNDYEVVPTAGDPEDLSTLRFLPFGKKPAPETDLFVNYYPRVTDPTPITDVNVGSVARTLVEAIARELGALYEQVELAYESAFLETSTGKSLDRVIALLAQERFRAGRPVGEVRLSRRPGSLGIITIAAGTPITDGADKIRYETVDTHQMLPAESVAEVRVRGATASTPVVEAGVLTVVQRSIAGIDSVTNPRPTTRATEDESDEELRRRVRGVLLGANKGTVAAIRNGLLMLPDVRAVRLEEMPNGVPGEIRVSVSLSNGTAGGNLPPSIRAQIEELRPAGIRVVPEAAGIAKLGLQVEMVLAGSHLPPVQVEAIRAQVRKRLVGIVRKSSVGQKVRLGPMVAAILGDERVVDARLTLSVEEQGALAPGEDFQPPSDVSVELTESDVSFAEETFEEAPPASGPQIDVEVRASVRATPGTGVPLEVIKTEITNRLTAFFASVTGGASVDFPGLLAALRDDAKYAVDPLSTTITLSAEEQFAQIVQGGPVFLVLPNHEFDVVSVEVTA